MVESSGVDGEHTSLHSSSGVEVWEQQTTLSAFVHGRSHEADLGRGWVGRPRMSALTPMALTVCALRCVPVSPFLRTSTAL